jgi:hypothetical protein
VEYLDRTFTDCPALQRVVLPRNLKKVSLTLLPTDHYLDVVLPEGMKAIPDYLFSNCTWLQTVTIPDSIESIGNSAFSHTALLSVKLPSGLREIGNYAFSRTDLSAVSIPSGVKTIGEYAFSGSGLTSVSGGEGLEAVGKFAFSSNPRLTRVSLDAAVPPAAAGAVFSYPYITVLNVPEQSVDAYKSAPYWEECYVCHGSPYQSKSFARDGEVVTLQTASSGNGIDITFIGDAYTDRYVSDGTYDRDMRAAAEVLRGRVVADGVRCIVIPATQEVFRQCMAEGLADVFLDANCVLSTPTCGPCLGGHMGVLAEGERCVATTNRNFVGRMGAKGSEVYLVNPAVAAASAVAGHIALPSDLD